MDLERQAILGRKGVNLQEAMRKVSAPTLLLYGRRDQLVDPRNAPKLAANFQDSRVVVIPDSGHVAQMEHPEMVAGVWQDLIGSTPPNVPA